MKARRLGKRITFRHHMRPKRYALDAQAREKKHQTLPELPEIADDGTAASTPILGGQPLQRKHSIAEDLHDWILGGQDGMVNVLGSILGVAVVTTEKRIILVAGLAALFAESISMAAVAYTSTKASRSYFESEREQQRKLIEENPVLQREILIDLYERKGLSRADAQRIVVDLTKDKTIWLDTIMEEHLRMYAPEETSATHSAIVVGFSSLLGSIFPILPFFFLIGTPAIAWSCIISVIGLFGLGAASAKLTIGDWKKRGFEMMIIGATAAAVSFLIGYIFVSGLVM